MKEHTPTEASSEALPPVLDDEAVAFETPRRRWPASLRARRAHRHREKTLSNSAVGLFILTYGIGAAAVGYFGSDLLLLAWLMAGALAVTVYLTFDGRDSLLNPYTLFFGVVTLASVAAHFIYGS